MEKTMNQKKVKRITTDEEYAEILSNRKKMEHQELKEKMAKISKQQKGDSNDFLSYLKEDDTKDKNTEELNCIGYPHNDPYGLSEAFWKIFTKPKV